MQTDEQALNDKIEKMTGRPPRPGHYLMVWSRPGDLAYVAGPYVAAPTPTPGLSHSIVEIEA